MASRTFVTMFHSSVLATLYNCLMRVVQKNENRMGKNINHLHLLQNKVLRTQPSSEIQRLNEKSKRIIPLGTGANGNN